MDPILDVAKAKGLVVIEDAAQALGAEYRPDGKSPVEGLGRWPSRLFLFFFRPRTWAPSGMQG